MTRRASVCVQCRVRLNFNSRDGYWRSRNRSCPAPDCRWRWVMKYCPPPVNERASSIEATICHALGDYVPEFLRRLDEVAVGEVSVSGSGSMPPVPEQPADQRQILARHDWQRYGEGHAGAACPALRPRKRLASRIRGRRRLALRHGAETGMSRASACRAVPRPAPARALPSGTARGPVLDSARLSVSSPMSRQRRLRTSLRRHPVSASNRMAAMATGPRGRRARAPAAPIRRCRGSVRRCSSGFSRYRDRGCYRARASPILLLGTSWRAVSRRRGWPRRACPCSPRRTTRPRPARRYGPAAFCRTSAAGCGP